MADSKNNLIRHSVISLVSIYGYFPQMSMVLQKFDFKTNAIGRLAHTRFLETGMVVTLKNPPLANNDGISLSI